MDLRAFLEELKNLKKLSEELFYYVEENEKVKSENLDVFLLELQKIIPKIIFFNEQTQIGDSNWLNVILEDLEMGIINEDIILFMDTLYNGLVSLIDEYIEIITEAMYE